MPTQTEIATNKAVLDSVDAKMAALDAAIVKFDDLVSKRAALVQSVSDLKQEEIGHLRNDLADENDIVESLTPLRARIDVQSARVNSLDDQIKEQQAQVISIGNSAGQAANTVWRQLQANRSRRAEQIFDSNFEMSWGARFPKIEFVNNSKLCREIANLSPHFNDYSKPTEVRIGQLRSFSKDYAPLRDALVAEPDLALAPVGAQTPSAPQLTVVGAAA